MKKILFIAFAISIVILAESPAPINALVLPYGGGFLTGEAFHYCTCTQNYLLTIYDKMTKSSYQYLFQPGVSTLNSEFNIFENQVNVIYGTMPTAIQCLDYHGEECDSYGEATEMIAPRTVRAGIGTSLTPSQ